MKTCTKCGSANNDIARLCDQCGSPLAQSLGRTCPSGRHIMDPSWTECVYCRQGSAPVPPGAGRGSGGRSSTVFEGASSAGQPPLRVAARSGTQLEDGGGRVPLPPRPVGPPSPPPRPAGPISGSRNATVLIPQHPSGSTPAGVLPVPSMHKDRRIVGVLVTYSWSPDGQIFPVREGRNFIGRDSDCDISIPEDTALSGRNSYITFRQNFVVGDMMVNMNGTDLDGQPIDGHENLRNYATIRAGATHFTFIAIKPVADEAKL